MNRAPVAVVIPTRNSRRLLGRTLASVAAQSSPPAQVLLVDRDSLDGLPDWLRLRWPGIELRVVARDADGAESLDAALAGVAAPAVAFLQPGERWPRDHLAALAAAWAHAPAADLVAAPSRPASPGSDGDGQPLSTLGARAEALRATAGGTGAETLLGEIRRRVGPRAAREGAASPARAATLDDGAGLAQQAVADPWAWAGLLERAAATVPASAEALVVDLQATSRPAGLLNLLGMGLVLGPARRSVQAMTLADLSWPALRAAPDDSPLILTSSAPLDLRHASDQLCVEELVRRAGKRPVRLVARGLVPSTPALLSRLLDTATAHPDLQLWLNDAVSSRYAASLLGPARVRLVPPPVLALARVLRDVTDRRLILPAMLGERPASPGLDLEARMTDFDLWACGFDPGAARRLAPALARVLGIWRWLKGPLLQKAWVTAITGWAAARAGDGEMAAVRARDLDVALFAALCGRAVELEVGDTKTDDFALTWSRALTSLGVRATRAGRAAALPPRVA